jgi:hypothetical protein
MFWDAPNYKKITVRTAAVPSRFEISTLAIAGHSFLLKFSNTCGQTVSKHSEPEDSVSKLLDPEDIPEVLQNARPRGYSRGSPKCSTQRIFFKTGTPRFLISRMLWVVGVVGKELVFIRLCYRILVNFVCTGIQLFWIVLWYWRHPRTKIRIQDPLERSIQPCIHPARLQLLFIASSCRYYDRHAR